MLNKCKTPQTRTTSQEIDQFKTVGYTRCSTKSQEDERESNQTQQDMIYRFCQSKQRHLIRTYPDTNSGDLENRPQLWKALQHAHEEGCSITVTKFDRLTRTPTLLDRIYGYGVPIIEAGTGKTISKTQAKELARKAARELDQKRASAKGVQRRHQPDLAAARAKSISVRHGRARQHADEVLERVVGIFATATRRAGRRSRGSLRRTASRPRAGAGNGLRRPSATRSRKPSGLRSMKRSRAFHSRALPLSTYRALKIYQ